MINNENDEYIATCKYDGEWTMFIKWDGQYLIRSRSLSKVTGAYGDKTAHLPHLVEEMKLWPDNTVILGEVCWGDFGSVSTDVGTILRCLPAKAVERQKEHKLQRDTAGGILPDVVLTDSQKLDITYNLYRDQLFFDYATRYRRQHDTIAPAAHFALNDEAIEDFCLFLDEKKFTYETETGRYLGELIEMAQQEDLDSTLLAELEVFKPRLTVDYRAAIQRNRKEVERLLGGEIVKRYYYHRGYYAYMLRYDKEFKRAIEEVKK